MSKRMKYYLELYKNLCQNKLSPEEAKKEAKKLLIQIQFFQHERLIHLIVTLLFAIVTVATMLFNIVVTQPILIILELALLILLIPYIGHYYLLENGTQKLYTYYDQLIKMTEEKGSD